MKPIIHRCYKSVDHKEDVKVYSYRRAALDTIYEKLLDILKKTDQPIQMTFELVNPRPMFSAAYVTLQYKVDKKVLKRIYITNTQFTEKEIVDLQGKLGSPVAFVCKELKATVRFTEKNVITDLYVDEDGGKLHFHRKLNRSTGRPSDRLTINALSFKSEKAVKELIGNLKRYENPKKPLRSIRDGVYGEVFTYLQHQTVLLSGTYITY